MRRVLLVRLNGWWRGFALALAVYALLGAAALVLAPDLAGLFLLGAYCIPANSIIPFPHEPAVLFAAKFYTPHWIALAATLGSLIAAFADYALVRAALRHPFFRGTRDSALFRWALGAMTRWPFAIIVVFSFTPLPISAIRILAPAAGYPIGRYALAQIIGRFPRFYALAWIGHALMIPNWVVLALLAVFLIAVYAGSRTRHTTGRDPPAP